MKVTLVPSVMLMDKFVLGEVRGEDKLVAYCCGVQIYVQRAVPDTYEVSQSGVDSSNSKKSNICKTDAVAYGSLHGCSR